MASTHIPNPSPSLETEPKRCQELWFEDGTIVLQAEDSTLFRVYAGHLSRYSVVFADMLSLPKSPNYNCNDQHEGCPLVKLSDSSSNLRAYLLSILDVKFYLKLSSAELALEDVIGILHLSTKYESLDLRSHTISVLSRVFPSTLKQFKKMQKHKWHQTSCGDMFYLANSASEVHADILLPSVLYLCCSKPLDDILDGGITSSGQAVNLDPVIFRLVVKSRRELEHLSQTRTLEYIFYWSGNDPVLDCRYVNTQQRSETCREKFVKVFKKHVKGQEFNFFDPFFAASKQLFSLLPLEIFYCDKCIEYFRDSEEKGMDSVWKDLPSVFNLPNWDDLTRKPEVE